MSAEPRAPRVTVLMTVFNDERFVGAAIESILGQTFTDFELIIVDDGSRDGTPAILARYQSLDDRVSVIRQENAGTTRAANHGLAHARGEYVARLDSDDRSFPDRLQIEVDFLDAHPDVALVGGGSEIIDEEGNTVGLRNVHTNDPARVLRHRCVYQQSDVMFRRSVVQSLGGYRDKFRNAQDYDLWLRISEVAPVAKLTDVFGQWRVNAGGYTYSRKQEQRIEVGVIRAFAEERRKHGRDSYGAYVPPPPAPHRQPLAPAEYDLLTGSLLLQVFRRTEARQRVLRSLRSRRSLYALVIYTLTFSPPFLIRGLGWLRDLYLNRFR